MDTPGSAPLPAVHATDAEEHHMADGEAAAHHGAAAETGAGAAAVPHDHSSGVSSSVRPPDAQQAVELASVDRDQAAWDALARGGDLHWVPHADTGDYVPVTWDDDTQDYVIVTWADSDGDVGDGAAWAGAAEGPSAASHEHTGGRAAHVPWEGEHGGGGQEQWVSHDAAWGEGGEWAEGVSEGGYGGGYAEAGGDAAAWAQHGYEWDGEQWRAAPEGLPQEDPPRDVTRWAEIGMMQAWDAPDEDAAAATGDEGPLAGIPTPRASYGIEFSPPSEAVAAAAAAPLLGYTAAETERADALRRASAAGASSSRRFVDLEVSSDSEASASEGEPAPAAPRRPWLPREQRPPIVEGVSDREALAARRKFATLVAQRRLTDAAAHVQRLVTSGCASCLLCSRVTRHDSAVRPQRNPQNDTETQRPPRLPCRQGAVTRLFTHAALLRKAAAAADTAAMLGFMRAMPAAHLNAQAYTLALVVCRAAASLPAQEAVLDLMTARGVPLNRCVCPPRLRACHRVGLRTADGHRGGVHRRDAPRTPLQSAPPVAPPRAESRCAWGGRTHT